MTIKVRLDIAMMEQNLAESRNQAQGLIMAGQVRLNGNVIIKPSETVETTDVITVDSGPQFVSRGGDKLLGALQTFRMLDFSGKVCADVGASTGGFTDCLLQHGAAKVYCIDVGYGILHWKIRQDERVVCMERVNARNVEALPELVDFVCVDTSFISLSVLLPVIRHWLKPEQGELIALIKPQFEAGREISAQAKGVIRDPMIHRAVLADTMEMAVSLGYLIKGLTRSPIQGPKGNKEFLMYCSNKPGVQPDLAKLIRQTMALSMSGEKE
jgi:23S rRNA (cytidine1920-2'-O)/16S rRNA (cytidine1409-2'-O)-methyltransferase